MTTQKEYSKEIKENVLRQLKPPINKSVKDIHLEMGSVNNFSHISEEGLYVALCSSGHGHLLFLE